MSDPETRYAAAIKLYPNFESLPVLPGVPGPKGETAPKNCFLVNHKIGYEHALKTICKGGEPLGRWRDMIVRVS